MLSATRIRRLGSTQKIAEDFLADFDDVWQEHGL
jgi:hypothetical protein